MACSNGKAAEWTLGQGAHTMAGMLEASKGLPTPRVVQILAGSCGPTSC
mgnify:CR=1 FL=1